ncbi:phosphatase PAP2 family protein [Streptomyces celluloflavus]|uniref:Phosphatase PAP2 family protein n=1 Tax=Streptomyces kasugaensis TaxID=1946 RepID=A0A4Q9HM44_STRKA|nr:phosphatase PAP2 family protein [Streptomyces kasugaensis]MYU53924.1 phosphatase PAP2 family protein [Streptomyces sp. SID7805]TBO55858.1 phosphatase PAP2 family protein [Streptomyces kasugaensis]
MTTLALGGASIDGGLYTWITDLAQRAPHVLNTLVSYWTDYGLGLFAVLMLIGWWRARHAGATAMAMALAAPVAVVAAYVANDVIKSFFNEQRPCQTLHTVTVEACPALGDWSFPSNHSAIAAAAAVAIVLCGRRLGWIAVPAALLMGASRIWVGAHYPHDVVVGLLIGALVAWPLTLLARRAAPAVDRLSATRLRPLVAAR